MFTIFKFSFQCKVKIYPYFVGCRCSYRLICIIFLVLFCFDLICPCIILVTSYQVNNLRQKWKYMIFTLWTHFRSASLDLILHFIEELSATDSCLEVMSSNDLLIQVLDKIVKLPDKFEVRTMLRFWYESLPSPIGNPV